MKISIHIHDQENNNNITTIYNVDDTITIKELKELYCQTKKNIDVKDVKAWAGTPFLDDNEKIIDCGYNLAYNIDIYMATNWSDEISSSLKYYLK